MANKSVAANSTWMALGTISSRITGVIRSAAVIAAIGFGTFADAFSIANSLPTIVYVVVVGGAGVSGNLYVGGVYIGDGGTNGLFWSANNIAVSTGGGTAFTGGVVATNIFASANLVANSATISTSNVTGAIVVSNVGGIGIGGNLYVGNRVGYVWTNNNASSAYTFFNNVTASLDTVFG